MQITIIDIEGTLGSYWEYTAACRVFDQLDRKKRNGLISDDDAKELQELQQRIDNYEADQNIFE